MKRIFALILALMMVFGCLVACNETPETPSDSENNNPSEPETLKYPAVDPANATLFVGYAREDITPTEEMIPDLSLTGYSEGRPIEEIRDSIFVSCTAFRDAEGDTALVYTLDLHSMQPSQATAFCSLITKAVKVPKANVILNVTHNHAAPGLASGTDFEEYVGEAIVKAAEDAIADLKACTVLYAGEVDMKYYSFIRRYITDDNGKPIAHMAEMDNMVPVARFVREGGKDVVLVNFAAHCDTVSGRAWNTLSGDYVWAFRRVVEHELDCHFSMQLGATGDVNPMTSLDEPNFYGKTDNYGKNLGYKIVNEIKNLPQLEIKGNVEAKASTVRVEIDHSIEDKLEFKATTHILESPFRLFTIIF